jgi:tetraacyldisaccharide 4'-kinase
MPSRPDRGPRLPADRGAASTALIPLSWLYRAGAAVHRRWPGSAPSPPGGVARIISVGNLEAGGNGKTPLAMWILEAAIARGERAAYVSRGYGGRCAKGPLVTRVCPPGAAPQAGPGERLLARDHPALAEQVGDEGAMVAGRVPGAWLFFGPDKAWASRAAAAAGEGVVVLDDAFQSHGVARHADIVLLDAERPFANGRLLPAGPLRETPAALARAHAVVFNGVRDEAELARASAMVRVFLRPGARVAGLVRRIALVPARAGAPRAPSRVLAVSAIARPGRFEASLATAGLACAGHEIRRDHHAYTAADATAIAARARALGVDAVVTTEKDRVKLAALDLPCELWVARLEVRVIGDDPCG